MHEKNNYKAQRWYDQDPTISLAVSFIRNASKAQQDEIADLIIARTTELGVKVNEIQILFKRRWFDENEKLSKAMEYLKITPEADQKVIAIDIINYLTEIKA